MFAPFTPLDRCIGKEVTVRIAGEEHVGMLAGVYQLGATPVLVITPMQGGGAEHHIPVAGAVVTVRHS